MQWLTTSPNPRSRRSSITHPDAGQRGWRVHAVEARPDETFEAVKGRPALCGLRPRHGWGMDAFIVDKCERCAKAVRTQT